jgi:hypothetical protein
VIDILLIGVVSLILPRLLHVDKVVHPITQHPANDKGSLPGRGQLVHAFGVLDQPEHKVSFAEFERSNLPGMIVIRLKRIYNF